MLLSAGMITTVIGMVIADRAGRFPAYNETLEILAGVLMIGGLGIVGFALQSILPLAVHQ